LVDGNNRRPFVSGEEFLSRGYSFGAIQTVDDSDLSLLAVDNKPFARPVGSLFKYSNSPEIYYLNSAKQKRPFTSWTVFTSWNNAITEVAVVPSTEQYPTGSPIEFPNGMLLKGSTPEIYLIEDGKARPFTTAQALLSRGYNFSQVVQVSAGELQLHSKGEPLH